MILRLIHGNTVSVATWSNFHHWMITFKLFISYNKGHSAAIEELPACSHMTTFLNVGCCIAVKIYRDFVGGRYHVIAMSIQPWHGHNQPWMQNLNDKCLGIPTVLWCHTMFINHVKPCSPKTKYPYIYVCRKDSWLYKQLTCNTTWGWHWWCFTAVEACKSEKYPYENSIFPRPLLWHAEVSTILPKPAHMISVILNSKPLLLDEQTLSIDYGVNLPTI